MIYELVNMQLFENDYYTETNIKYDINKEYGYYPKKDPEFVEKFYKDKLFANKYTINEYGHRKNVNFEITTNECIVFLVVQLFLDNL